MTKPIMIGDVQISYTDEGVRIEVGWQEWNKFIDIPEEDRLDVSKALLPEECFAVKVSQWDQAVEMARNIDSGLYRLLLRMEGDDAGE